MLALSSQVRIISAHQKEDYLMKTWLSTTIAISIAAAAFSLAAPTIAGAKPEKGMKYYTDHQFDYAIESCKTGKDTMSKLILGLSYTEKYNIYRNKADREQAKIYLNILEVEANMENILTIAKFLNIPGNPNGNKEALALLKDAFRTSSSSVDDILKMAGFLAPDKGVDVNKAALSSLKKTLKPVRDYVSKGGTMPIKMKKLFANPELLRPLVGSLAEKKTLSYAKSCLTIIEEPSLELLEQQEMTKGVSDAIVSVKKAIARRTKKFPGSSWHSALGE
jgi:hypothetical protein